MITSDSRHPQSGPERDFSSHAEEASYLKARANYVSERTDFHLQNPAHAELDILTLENGCVAKFLATSQKDLEKAGVVLFFECYQLAIQLAEQDADNTDYQSIMESR